MLKKLLTAVIFISGLSMSQVALASDWWIDIKNDRVSKVEQALLNGQDPNAVNNYGDTGLMQAVREGSMRVFDVILSSPKVKLNRFNHAQETVLMYIALVGDVARAQKLVAKGAEVNRLGWSPLHYAAVKGHTPMIKYLLSQKALPNNPAPDGSSPLMLAVSSRKLDAVKALLEGGADPLLMNDKKINALALAQETKQSSMVKLMQQHVDKMLSGVE